MGDLQKRMWPLSGRDRNGYYFDDTDSNGQATFDVGASVTVNFQMEGNTSGDHKLSGTALITGKDVSVASDGMVEATYSMQITGGLTEGTVS